MAQDYSLSFDGEDDWVDLGNPQLLQFGDSDFTVSAWFKTTIVKRQWIINNHPNHMWAIGCDVQDNECHLHIDIRASNSSIDTFGNLNVADGNWHNVVLIRNSDNFTLFLDGNIEIDIVNNVGSLNSSSNLKIGAESTK